MVWWGTPGEALGPVRRGGQGPGGITPLWRLIASLVGVSQEGRLWFSM